MYVFRKESLEMTMRRPIRSVYWGTSQPAVRMATGRLHGATGKVRRGEWTRRRYIPEMQIRRRGLGQSRGCRRVGKDRCFFT